MFDAWERGQILTKTYFEQEIISFPNNVND